MRELHLDLDPLYPITALAPAGGSGHLQLIDKYLEAGAPLFHLRDQLLNYAYLHEQPSRIKQLCPQTNGDFIVNYRVDLALASDAAAEYVAVGPLLPSSIEESDNRPPGVGLLRAAARERLRPISLSLASAMATAQDPTSRTQSYFDKWLLC